MRPFAAGLLAACVALLATQPPSHAQAPANSAAAPGPQGPIHSQLLRELIVWAAEYRGRPMPAADEAPLLQPLDDGELRRVVCAATAEQSCHGAVAAYEPALRRIVYRATLDLRQHFDRSFIVHELVHWLQHREGQTPAPSDCRGLIAVEREAYAAQNRYLDHHRVYRRLGGQFSLPACAVGGS